MVTSVGMLCKVASSMETDVVFMAPGQMACCMCVMFSCLLYFLIASLWLLSMEYVT